MRTPFTKSPTHTRPWRRSSDARATYLATAAVQRAHHEESGFLLVEILVSTMLVGIIVIGTMSGFEATNREQGQERARSAADSLAQQAEDQLRGEPVTTLEKYEDAPLVRTATLNGTTFTVTSRVTFESDASGTASCTSASPKADYLLSTSEVTWPALGVRPPIVERGLIAPPPSTALLVDVTDQSANPVPGATASVSGASTSSLETSSLGCATFVLLPGEYSLNVLKAGYVTPNWYPETDKDPADAPYTNYLTAGTTTKRAYSLGQAGTLEVNFKSSATAAEGDTAVVHSALMSPAYKTLGIAGTYTSALTTGKEVYPGKYTVYAGTCESDLPSPAPAEVEVPPGGSASTTVKLPPVKILVKSGSGSSSPGAPVSGASVKVTDNGCGTVRTFTTNAAGEIPAHAALPYGSYSLCVTNSTNRWQTTTLSNNTENGPSSTSWSNGGTSAGVATIYLGTGASGVSAGTCP